MADGKREKTQILVPKERVFSRGQGCWNCIHWNQQGAKQHWTARRQRDLETAAAIALQSPRGENDVRCDNIKRSVDQLDHLVAMGGAGLCPVGVDGDGNPVDLVHHAYKCHHWSGKSGASLASDGKQDPLPGELRDKLDN